MKDIIIIKSIFLFMCFWGLGVILVYFRPKVDLFWKAIATVIFAFYAWFFFDEIQLGFNAFKAGWYVMSVHFLKEFAALVFVNLFFFWPLALVIIFYKSDPIESERLLKFMSILTIVLWIVFIIYFYYSSGIDKFLFEKLKKMIPYAN